MPMKPLKPCKYPNCPGFTKDRFMIDINTNMKELAQVNAAMITNEGTLEPSI